MPDQPPNARPLVLIPARFSESASALRYRAEVAAAKLLQAVWAAGGEPIIAHPTAPEPRIDELAESVLDGQRHPAARRR